MGKMSELTAELAELKRCGEVLIGISETLTEMFSGADTEPAAVPKAEEKPAKKAEKKQKAKEVTNGRIIARMAQNVIYYILIHIKLADKSRLKIAGFQFDYHITTKFKMIEQKINIKIISAYFQMYLSAHERKSLSQLQKEVLDMFGQLTLNLYLTPRHIGTEKIKQI